MTLEKKAKAPLTNEQLVIREANQQKAAVYKERRIALGLLQKELAQKAGVSVETIANMETGRHLPTWKTCQKIRRAMEMPEEQLYSTEQLAAMEANRQKAVVYKEYRVALGLSQEQLAEKAGVVVATISNMESGRHPPSWKTRQKIRRAMEMPEEVPEEQIYSIKSKVSLTDEQLAIREANRQKAAPYRERRISLGFSQKELTEKAGVDHNCVYKMESGNHWPRWETRQKIRRALGMPEERVYSIEERNAIFFELNIEDSIEWIIRKNISTLKAMGAILYLEDFRQHLALCAIRAIDRFQADGGASLGTFVTANLTLFAKTWIAKFNMRGMSGAIKYPLPKIRVLSLDALRESGFEIAG